ncbi:MAG: molybdopterin-dependent oxidoreductase, partial [Ktedonobacteraceae bacterium]
RTINMVQLAEALHGELPGPPVQALYVYNSNPAAVCPDQTRVLKGLMREDLFTVAHELFVTETARYADILLPATSQLEHIDLHKAYGHLSLQYNTPAIAPRGEARSNWDVMRALASAMNFNESWLQEDADAVIRGVLNASAQVNPLLQEITLERLQAEGSIPLPVPADQRVPFADGVFRTPSGKVEFYSEQAVARGYDPVPGWQPEEDIQALNHDAADTRLPLLSPAAHHFVSSTFGNQERLLKKEGAPTLHIHPCDAALRGICHGQLVRVSNERGECHLIADVTEDVRPGILATATVWWPKFSPDQRNVNWTTSDRLADFNGGCTFYTNLVSIAAI